MPKRELSCRDEFCFELGPNISKKFVSKNNFPSSFPMQDDPKKFDVLVDKKLKGELFSFLEHKKEQILSGEYLPSLESILEPLPKLKNYQSLSQERQRWIEKNTSFRNYTELKNYFEGTPLYTQLRNFLYSKKEEILSGEFIPSSDKIIALRPEFKNYPSITAIVRNWLRNEIEYKNITEFKKDQLDPFADRVRIFLESKKNDILNGEFIPDRKNIIIERPDFSDYKNLTSTVIRWLRKNTDFKNITKLKETLLGPHIRDQIRNFLDFNKENILSGQFVPSSKNLRKVNRDFGDYENSHIVVAEWLINNSPFNNLTEMIEFFSPTKKELGLSGTHEYTPDFLDEKFRINNALFQTVKIIDDNHLELIKIKTIDSWNKFFNIVGEHSKYFFIDIITGEIITKADYSMGKVAFHHIDGDKQNDNVGNLVFLLNTTHGFLTTAQRFDEELNNFFIDLIKENLRDLLLGHIPLSWKVGWKDIAQKKGISIPPSRYEKSEYHESVLKLSKKIKSLDDWIK